MLFAFVLLCVAVLATGELYSSVVGLETLLDTQRTVLDTLDAYIETTEAKLRAVKRHRVSYMELAEASSRDFPEFVSHPVNAFVLIKRLSTDWDRVKGLMREPVKESGEGHPASVFPDSGDLTGAAKALLRVQQTYGLDAGQLSEGRMFGRTALVTLDGDECFELGRQAYSAGLYENAVPWLELARSKGFTGEVDTYIKAAEMEKERSAFMLFTNNLLQLGLMSMDDPPRSKSNQAFAGGQHTNFFDEMAYRQLCQSSMRDVSATSTSSAVLRCRTVSPHPSLVLSPVKEEELWSEPRIALYHGVVSQREMDALKGLALPALQRAEVTEYTSSLGHRVSDTRVTKVAWLRGGDHPLVRRLYAGIEAVTGLSSASAEPFQLANYGLGGHFHLHMDVLPDTETYFGAEMGNRVATWMYYLSDVQGGGATVFPRLNITVWPRKGSALFWHNMDSDGAGNILTLHGACPVVAGSKWVANVWYHERGQEFRLKCGMRPESPLIQTNLLGTS